MLGHCHRGWLSIKVNSSKQLKETLIGSKDSAANALLVGIPQTKRRDATAMMSTFDSMGPAINQCRVTGEKWSCSIAVTRSYILEAALVEQCYHFIEGSFPCIIYTSLIQHHFSPMLTTFSHQQLWDIIRKTVLAFLFQTKCIKP